MPTPGRSPRLLRQLAAVLAQPEPDALAALHEQRPDLAWLSAAALDELNALPLEHWQAEHTRLFINGYPRTPCPPFESAYRQGQMGGTAGADLQSLYHALGLEADPALADYLGTLLECAAYLAEQPAGHCRLEQILWQDHLLHWLPRFAADLQAQAGLLLYRELGVALAGVCP